MGEADKRKQDDTSEATSLLDVVEEVYPEKVGGLFGGLSQIGQLFTVEDWLVILTRSRSSIEDTWKGKK